MFFFSSSKTAAFWYLPSNLPFFLLSWWAWR